MAAPFVLVGFVATGGSDSGSLPSLLDYWKGVCGKKAYVKKYLKIR